MRRIQKCINVSLLCVLPAVHLSLFAFKFERTFLDNYFGVMNIKRGPSQYFSEKTMNVRNVKWLMIQAQFVSVSFLWPSTHTQTHTLWEKPKMCMRRRQFFWLFSILILHSYEFKTRTVESHFNRNSDSILLLFFS